MLLWLAHVEGSEHREIAEALGLKAASVPVLLFRARRKLAAGFASLVVFLVWQWKGLSTLVARAIPAGLSALSTAAPPRNPLVLVLLACGTATVGAMVLAGLHRLLSRTNL
jgi:hypothetical protein